MKKAIQKLLRPQATSWAGVLILTAHAAGIGAIGTWLFLRQSPTVAVTIVVTVTAWSFKSAVRDLRQYQRGPQPEEPVERTEFVPTPLDYYDEPRQGDAVPMAQAEDPGKTLG